MTISTPFGQYVLMMRAGAAPDAPLVPFPTSQPPSPDLEVLSAIRPDGPADRPPDQPWPPTPSVPASIYQLICSPAALSRYQTAVSDGLAWDWTEPEHDLHAATAAEALDNLERAIVAAKPPTKAPPIGSTSLSSAPASDSEAVPTSPQAARGDQRRSRGRAVPTRLKVFLPRMARRISRVRNRH